MKLTDEQVIKMAKLAILASVPVGMGHLHHQPDLTEDDITNIEINNGRITVDYYQGRMVKFYGKKETTGWEFGACHHEYQSWIRKYPTYEALAEAAFREMENA